MTVYVIADIEVTDDKWLPDYAVGVLDILHKHGGKYLARSANITTLEGEPSSANLIALLQFPTLEAARAFTDDPDYLPYGKARRDGSVSRLHVVDDTDAAGVIPYLGKG